jgi:hypothetical protein
MREGEPAACGAEGIGGGAARITQCPTRRAPGRTVDVRNVQLLHGLASTLLQAARRRVRREGEQQQRGERGCRQPLPARGGCHRHRSGWMVPEKNPEFNAPNTSRL